MSGTNKKYTTRLAVPQIGKKLRLYESLPGDSFDGLLHELQCVPVVAEISSFAVNGSRLAVGEAAAVIVHAAPDLVCRCGRKGAGP